jgi:ribosomal protein S18 acetylase RimI-like enzyme
MTNFSIATTKTQFADIAQLADIIWREHYIPIIGLEQVDYMIKNYQSAEAMYSQFIDGYRYFMIYCNDQFVGYISIKKEDKSLFLSKIYVSKEYRGKKIGKSSMDFVQEKALEMHCKSITLGVNRFNVNAIEAYKAMGFKIIEEMITDIGNGFIMDDYKMEKLIF